MQVDPQELSYNFSVQLTRTNGDGQTFSLTLTHEVLENIERVNVHYFLNSNLIGNIVHQHTVGVMRSTVAEEPSNGQSTSRLLCIARYTHALQDALGYATNPRNLEAFWKPVYRNLLLEVIFNMESCDVNEEIPIWVFNDARDNMPLAATVSMPAGSGKTVFPDLSVVARIGTTNMPNEPATTRRFLPVLVELKRAVSRSLTVLGYPDPNNPTPAIDKLIQRFSAAQPQVELTAYLLLQRAQSQTHVVLIAAVGSWLRAKIATRDEIFSSTMVVLSDLEVLERIEGYRDEQQPSADGNDDPLGLDPLNPNEQAQFPEGIPDATFRNAAGDGFNDLSYLPGWYGPVKLGTPEAFAVWSRIREHIRRGLSTGRM